MGTFNSACFCENHSRNTSINVIHVFLGLIYTLKIYVKNKDGTI